MLVRDAVTCYRVVASATGSAVSRTAGRTFESDLETPPRVAASDARSTTEEDEIVDVFHGSLIVATLLCTLVAGFVFAFAVVVMPGIRTLGDGEFLRAFQVMDRVIQNGRPIFMLVWVGSVVALVASAALGFGQLDWTGRGLLIAAAVGYLAGVQLPTAVINIPLNNNVQALAIGDLDAEAQASARRAFEARWNAANTFRTFVAGVVSALLMILLLRL